MGSLWDGECFALLAFGMGPWRVRVCFVLLRLPVCKVAARQIGRPRKFGTSQHRERNEFARRHKARQRFKPPKQTAQGLRLSAQRRQPKHTTSFQSLSLLVSQFHSPSSLSLSVPHSPIHPFSHSPFLSDSSSLTLSLPTKIQLQQLPRRLVRTDFSFG